MITDQELWNDYVAKNDDPYGRCCADVARRVMELLDEDPTPLHEGYHPDVHTPHGLICKADDDIKAGGITGFMAGAVAQMVSRCHSRGTEFRTVWNKEYGVEHETGVVNPAIVMIDTGGGSDERDRNT